MHIDRFHRGLLFAALAAAAGPCGCALVTVPVVAAGAGSEVNFTDTTDYRSFTHPQAQVRAAALKAFERMQITTLEDENRGDGVRIKGKTAHLAITVVLTPVTPAVTKVSVNAKKNWLMKDQTVAAEILFQIARQLDRGL